MPNNDPDQLGRYQVLRELGRGAMGMVYQARDPRIDRLVAIKTISVPPSSAGNAEDFRERFFREARAAGRLSHPGIVTIYDVAEDSERGPFIVMEYVPGRTLEHLLSAESEQKLSADTALDLAQQLAEALAYAHEQGIVHRDIKPANIIVTGEGRAKITDFGIAKLDLTQFTATGQVFGTPSFMSPEQIEGEAVDARSDLFSLGVVLYSMLTGYRPFQGNSAATISFKLVYKDPVPVTALNSALPVHLDYVVSRALAKAPQQRYQSGQEMALDLADIRSGAAPRSLNAESQPSAADATQVHSVTRTENVWKRHVLGRTGGSKIRRVYAIGRQKAVWLTTFALVTAAIAGMLYRTHRTAAAAPAVANAADGESSSVPPTAPSTSLTPPTAQQAATPVAPQPAPAVASGTGQPLPAPVALKSVPKSTHESAPKSSLAISVQSSFDSATLSIYIDDKMTFQRAFTGEAKKKMLVMKSVQGDFSGSTSVPVGKHELRVELSSEQNHYLGVSRLVSEFAPHEAKTLTITVHGHDRQMLAKLD